MILSASEMFENHRDTLLNVRRSGQKIGIMRLIISSKQQKSQADRQQNKQGG
ncbi:14402_t:CDS:2 [Rhizophagus irregularis]|nr:14402_t:CDS:2 [Rhizophagus irregularis]